MAKDRQMGGKRVWQDAHLSGDLARRDASSARAHQQPKDRQPVPVSKCRKGFDGFWQQHQQHAVFGVAAGAQHALSFGSGSTSSSPYAVLSPCVKKVSQRTPAVSVTHDLSDFA